MTDLVALGIEIYSDNEKTTSSNSSKSMHDFITLHRNPKDDV